VLSEHGCSIAPSTFYDAVSRRPSRRQLRDEQLMQIISDERESNRFVAGLGARKMWLRLRGQGHDVARCTVERLMAQMGITGLTRQQRRVRTTIADPAAARPLDLVDRHFAATAPNQLWVADFTYCPTWSGMVYVAFVFDVFSRRVLGWRAATKMTTPLVLDCLEQAIWTRKRDGVSDLSGLVHHTDAGSQGGFNWSSQHLVISEVFGGSSTASSRSCGASEVEVAWSSEVPARGRGRVLGGDRERVAA
jgi:putative transposase